MKKLLTTGLLLLSFITIIFGQSNKSNDDIKFKSEHIILGMNLCEGEGYMNYGGTFQIDEYQGKQFFTIFTKDKQKLVVFIPIESVKQGNRLVMYAKTLAEIPVIIYMYNFDDHNRVDIFKNDVMIISLILKKPN